MMRLITIGLGACALYALSIVQAKDALAANTVSAEGSQKSTPLPTRPCRNSRHVSESFKRLPAESNDITAANTPATALEIQPTTEKTETERSRK
ncbi:hypothetical protein BG006_004372 [Podila minutissima]|uniref:Uncharacterized protein n=1 Tax=Podila minutissima TaxID=64525 RepID=A0A9P5SNR2_9FUNG|nr:hypothetical protein BG006_004372 [Podila minutissima]